MKQTTQPCKKDHSNDSHNDGHSFDPDQMIGAALAEDPAGETAPSEEALPDAVFEKAAAPMVCQNEVAGAAVVRTNPSAFGLQSGRDGTGALLPLAAVPEEPKDTLGYWATRYLAEEVFGLQSPNTLDAKRRDLAAFIRWFVALNGTSRMAQWLPRDTQAYLDSLEAQGRAATTINRAFASLRHFVRWANDQPGGVFAEVGLPTRGIKELTVDEPDCKKFERRDMHRLFKAADNLVLTKRRKNQRPRRNRAILALLYYTGLRVSELVQLRRDQYDGRYLSNVKRKGRARSKGLYVNAECRALLDDYLVQERHFDVEDPKGTEDPLIMPNGSSRHLTRRMVAIALDQIADEASKHPGVKRLDIHPHRLRHTFGAEYREKTGSDTETAAALGHTGLGYVGRYVRKTQAEREQILDAF